LVVDDDQDHLESARTVLEDAGYHVRTAVDGVDALRVALTGQPPDLILLDLYMPRMDGWAFVAQLKAQAELPRIPVVAMTGAGDRALRSAPVCAGYLSKPMGAARLLETVGACLARRRGRPPENPRG
jgi:two-component system OmpR family response regulator